MKKFFLVVFSVITFLPAIFYFFGCLTPYISPVTFWPMAFLALAFPYLAASVLILSILWLFVRKKVALYLFLLFLAGFQNLSATFALNPMATSTVTKEEPAIRILTWNVRGFGNPTTMPDSAYTVRKQMFDYIKEVNPDVLVLQEFSEHFMKGTSSNTADLKKLGYHYFNRTDEIKHTYPFGKVLSGSAIFSRVPISNPTKVMLGDSSYPEYIASVDVLLQGKPIRVFSTHFKSLNLFAGPADTSNHVVLYGDKQFVYKSTKFEKLKYFAQAHTKEVYIARDVVNKSPIPVVIGIDMNSVPASFPYHALKDGLQDPFKLHSWGFGTTMADLPKNLRIDFIFVDKRLSVINFRKENISLSDHFPQYIDVGWKNN